MLFGSYFGVNNINEKPSLIDMTKTGYTTGMTDEVYRLPTSKTKKLGICYQDPCDKTLEQEDKHFFEINIKDFKKYKSEMAKKEKPGKTIGDAMYS